VGTIPFFPSSKTVQLFIIFRYISLQNTNPSTLDLSLPKS
jgi:hypothetical protein